MKEEAAEGLKSLLGPGHSSSVSRMSPNRRTREHETRTLRDPFEGHPYLQYLGLLWGYGGSF